MTDDLHSDDLLTSAFSDPMISAMRDAKAENFLSNNLRLEIEFHAQKKFNKAIP